MNILCLVIAAAPPCWKGLGSKKRDTRASARRALWDPSLNQMLFIFCWHFLVISLPLATCYHIAKSPTRVEMHEKFSRKKPSHIFSLRVFSISSIPCDSGRARIAHHSHQDENRARNEVLTLIAHTWFWGLGSKLEEMHHRKWKIGG